MKSFPLFAILMVLFSCSPEDNNLPAKISPTAYRVGDGYPVNHANPYENSGILFDAIFDLYYDADPFFTSSTDIANRIEYLAGNHPDFLSLKTVAYQPVEASRIDYLLAHPSSCMNEMLLSSQLSERARNRLKIFITTVVPLCANASDYDPVHDYILDFENVTLADSVLTPKDKQVILTTTSITRYSSYKARKKPKKRNDPEWDMLVVQVTAGAEGADKGVCEAVSNALATGIAGQ